ncbi:MAG: exodeoxyribonuclease 7 large subunit [Alphaproteobacteria bacterium]|nr:MAG: exodeoxyribonuclease 7 large subunit [Alphaproteobacteria bacterium]
MGEAVISGAARHESPYIGPMTEAAAAAAQSNLPELSVSELAQAVKRTMETNFDRVRVRGELGRVMIAKSGHLYVDLKDENATIATVMWKSNVAALTFKPEEGLEVVAEGRLSTFPGRSQYQLIAERMSPAGVGALLAQLEKLKAKLQAEGLFARERKKPIPYLPRTIGVVTSPTGAVIRDILHRLRERFPRRVIVWPVLVQGPEAAGQVARAIRGFNALEGDMRPDVLIVARGGGSIEDLWAFNEEIVVRAAAESQIPLISAVGHETDTTLIDYASDLRAPTPTGAAEKAVPVRAELIDRVTSCEGRLKHGLLRGLERRRTELRAAAARLPRLETLFQIPQQRYDRAAERLNAALVANTRAAQSKLDRVAARLRPEALGQDIVRRRDHLARTAARLEPAIRRALDAHRKHLDGAGRMLDSLSHKSVLARGFVMVHREDGTLVRAAKDLSSGDIVELTFADDKQKAVIDPGSTAAAPETPRPKAKPKPGGDQGSLF